MNKLCLDHRSGKDSDTTSNCYVKGYNINYDALSSESTSYSSSQFLTSVFDKSISPKNKTPPKVAKEQSRKQQDQVPTVTLTPQEIQNRCRISYTCRNNLVCIEGHATKK